MLQSCQKQIVRGSTALQVNGFVRLIGFKELLVQEPMKPIVKELTSEEELIECVRLLRKAFGTVAKDFNLTEQSAPTNAAFTTLENLYRHIHDGLKFYGMIYKDSLIGCIAVKKAKRDGRIYYIERLAVDPEYRHKGHGNELLQYALERIRERGGTTASIGLIDNNYILKKWYITKGFAQNDCRRVANLPFKVCYMSKNII